MKDYIENQREFSASGISYARIQNNQQRADATRTRLDIGCEGKKRIDRVKNTPRKHNMAATQAS